MSQASGARAPVTGFLFAAILAFFATGTASAIELGDASGPPQRIIVKFKEDHAHPNHSAVADQVRAAISLTAGVALEHSHVNALGADVLKVGRRVDAAGLASLIGQFKSNPAVEYAEEDRLLHATFTPNDSRYNEQWHYFEANGGLRLPGAWDLSTGTGVVVAVIDTGYRPHADLVANLVQGYDFISDTAVSVDGNGRDSDAQDPGDWYTNNACGALSGSSNSSWHGTHVAGTIAAVTNNASGVAGVAYNAKVLPARVLGKCGGYTSDIADAIIWASGGTVSGVPANANPAKVLSLSLGGSGACDTTSQNAINSARSRGAVFIVAAGNENTNASNSSPANCAGAVVVAAVNRSGGRASYSNYGTIVDVAAPGGQQSSLTDPNGILSTLNAGTQGPGADSYAFYQGTSMATPHVSGVAALMLAKTPGMTPDQIEAQLKATARAFPATCSGCGTGIVDATAALGGTVTPPPPPPGPTVLTNGVAKTGLAGATGSQQNFTLAVTAGATGLKFVMSGGTGDADMYVKFGSAPTTSSYDCRPYVNGNAETCNIASAQAGTYYVMLSGYAAYSGVSLTGSFTPASSGGGSCPAGYTAYASSLSGTGANYYAPSSSGYVSSVSGTHAATLAGPSGTDFDLYLQKLNGSSWSNAKSSTGTTSSETISYAGTSGTYRWRVYSYSGSGAFTLCQKHP
jgi:serine protease